MLNEELGFSVLRNDLLMKSRISLYNNLGRIDDVLGRLMATLEISPSPRLAWEFEVLGPHSSPWDGKGTHEWAITGHDFQIHDAQCTGHGHTAMSEVLSGVAPRACYGDVKAFPDYVRFYLPNLRCIGISWEDQRLIEADVQERSIGSLDSVPLSHRGEARAVEVPISGGWTIRLVTSEEALDWLDKSRSNTGTLLTTEGHLYRDEDLDQETGVPALQPTRMSLPEAERVLLTLCTLLSFANGGYVGPLYIHGETIGESPHSSKQSSAIVGSYLTTPVEALGTTWVTDETSLPRLLGCFSSLVRMLSQPPWSGETFYSILGWYFQAIQPTPGLWRGPLMWPAAASAAGSALERLAYTILVAEESDSSKQVEMENWFSKSNYRGRRTSEARVEFLLERMGVHPNYRDHVKDFVDLRNEAVHPKPGRVPVYQRENLIQSAMQWVEEAILWRLGYDGKYRHRIGTGYGSTQHRYDLARRKPEW